jgi:hypothetical protein
MIIISINHRISVSKISLFDFASNFKESFIDFLNLRNFAHLFHPFIYLGPFCKVVISKKQHLNLKESTKICNRQFISDYVVSFAQIDAFNTTKGILNIFLSFLLVKTWIRHSKLFGKQRVENQISYQSRV